MIALATGVTMKGKKQWTAHAVNLQAYPSGEGDGWTVSMTADTEYEAAREAALSVSKAIYGQTGEVGFVTRVGLTPVFYVSVGLQEHSEGGLVLVGSTLKITVAEYNGA